MSLSADAFVAAHRFGMGPRPGELSAAGANPRGWLAAQIRSGPEVPAALASLPHSSETLIEFLRARRQGVPAVRRLFRSRMREVYRREVDARAIAMITSATPLVERMTAFWSNHFTVSATRFFIAPVAGAYEREAIRPHVFGRFEDILGAVIRHPAMLAYLDNIGSIGPRSRGGRILRRGLNENLAREILELHTLGVDGGYSQRDVTELARILTGWTVGGIGRRMPLTGRFMFASAAHEPGPKTLLGRRYPESGEEEGEQAIRHLASHPATARFVATKLVRHFVLDDPPDAAVRRVEQAFNDTGGDLAAVTRTLIGLSQAWSQPLAKVKSAHDLVIATGRALTIDRVPPNGFLPNFHTLQQRTFWAPSPAGWPDRADDWISPEALMRRIEWTRVVAARVPRRDAGDVLERTIGPVARDATRRVVGRAATADEALALVLGSAEFQRR